MAACGGLCDRSSKVMEYCLYEHYACMGDIFVCDCALRPSRVKK